MSVLFDPTYLHPEATEDRGVTWRCATLAEANELLAERHYLGPMGKGTTRAIVGGFADAECVAAQIWRLPTARYLPADGSWLELSRWCLTPEAGSNAGSRMHRFVARLLRIRPEVTTLVSYSDPSQGHTGALYKACNWTWAPTWHRLRPPPSGNGSWSGRRQEVKDRWVFALRPDSRRADVLSVKDTALSPANPPAAHRLPTNKELLCDRPGQPG